MAEKGREKFRDVKEGAYEMKEQAKEKAEEFAEKGKEKFQDFKESEQGQTLSEKAAQFKRAANEFASEISENFGQNKKDKESIQERRAREKEEAEEPSFARRAAEKLGEFTEKMTGKPVYKRENYKTETKEGLRKEVRQEEELRRDDIKKAIHKPEKDMFDLRDNQQWKDLLKKSSKPIVVDFYKTDSGECRRMYPKLMDKFKDSSESWILVGANAEVTKELAKEFKVDEYPTLILFHKGKMVEKCRKGDNVEEFMSKVMNLSK